MTMVRLVNVSINQMGLVMPSDEDTDFGTISPRFFLSERRIKLQSLHQSMHTTFYWIVSEIKVIV
jgi:hypothetical protein